MFCPAARATQFLGRSSLPTDSWSRRRAACSTLEHLLPRDFWVRTREGLVPNGQSLRKTHLVDASVEHQPHRGRHRLIWQEAILMCSGRAQRQP